MLETYENMLAHVQPVGISGRVSGVRGLTVSVRDFPAPLGAGCRIIRGPRRIEARVIGFAGDSTLVMAIGPMAGICRGDRVVMTSPEQTVGVGRGMLGRVLDGFGRPLDGQGEFEIEKRGLIWPPPTAPMQRPRIEVPLATGVRAIDAMLTVGRGQRMGVFSGSGAGKSVLLGMIARGTAADVTVIALIGERGREVREFIDKNLGPDGMKRSVVIASTSDEPPLMRVQAGAVATTVAEYFRDQGCNVLLLMDSLTRLADAQRQIGLAAGEPPATRGYPPSVFGLLPELLERTGPSREGSITGFYSALVEADDLNDPISQAVRSVADGHVFLSGHLANRGHWPAIDVLRSVSRVMIDVTDRQHQDAARDVHRQLALYAEIEEMVNIGAYSGGGNEEYDLAVRMLPEIRRFLAQGIGERADFEKTKAALKALHRSMGREVRRPLTGAARTAAAASGG